MLSTVEAAKTDIRSDKKNLSNLQIFGFERINL